MALRRYTRSPIIKSGRQFGTSSAARSIFNAVENNVIRVTLHVVQEGERLDVIAGKFYGDGRKWWIIAAASGIGWGLQVPPGTRLRIPSDLSQISALVG
jgi:nucleoid-associated protein YgaU